MAAPVGLWRLSAARGWLTGARAAGRRGESRSTVRRTPRPQGSATGGIAGIPTVLIFEGSLSGRYRIFSGTPEYRFYRSNTAPPQEGDVPDDTNATLPYLSNRVRYVDGTWWLAVSYYNGVIDSGFYPIGPNGEPTMEITLANLVLAGTQAPNGPFSWQLIGHPDGSVTIQALYVSGSAPLADQFTWSATNDGTTPPDPLPNPIDNNPTQSPFLGFSPITDAGVSVMEALIPAQPQGTTVTVKLATEYQQFVGQVFTPFYSVIETKTLVVDTVGPAAATDGERWPGRTPEDNG